MSLLSTAEDPSVFHRCGDCSCSTPRRLMGRQCGRMCWRPSYLWPGFFLRSFRVWVGYRWNVWWLQHLLLFCIPWKDSSSTRIYKEKSALQTVPLLKSLEPFWWGLSRIFNYDYGEFVKIKALITMNGKLYSLKLKQKIHHWLLVWPKLCS